MKYIDQTGHKITLNRQAVRIVSVVPSQTELLYYLGIEPIGQTVFCIHPSDKFDNARKIGGTKKLQLSKIEKLNPDLILGNKEENDKEQINKLRQRFPVWLSDIKTIDDALQMILSIGELIGKSDQALQLKNEIEDGFGSFNLQKKRTVLYLIWKDPYMAAGKNTYINSVIEAAGYINALTPDELRYPSISDAEIRELNPDEIWLSSEPYPFKDKHITELQQSTPNAAIKLVNGELFSWYGPRMLETVNYLRQ